MYRVGMIGLGTMGMPIARRLMGRGFEIIGRWAHGSPALAVACSFLHQVCGVSAVDREEWS